MNAQEAIEVAEQLDVFHEKNHKALEALSIVLESAKLFHEETVPILFTLHDINPERVKTVYGVPIEKVGIDLSEYKEVLEE